MTQNRKGNLPIDLSHTSMPAYDGNIQDCIFIKDYIIDCNIGVYAEEKGVTQKVRLTVDAYLAEGVRSINDEMIEVPSYTDILDAIEEIKKKGHINLVETFAEQISQVLLLNKKIRSVRVVIEKLERGPVRGVQIFRVRNS